MKSTIKLYLNDGEGPNGYPVKLILTHQKKITRKTLAHVSMDNWDSLRELPLPSYPDFENLYTRILEIRAKSIGSKFKEFNSLKEAMDYLLNVSDVKPKMDFYTYLKHRCDYMRSVGREGNAIAIEAAEKQFIKVAPYLEFKDFNPQLITAFKTMKRLDGSCNNVTIRKYVSAIRAVYNTGIEELQLEDKQPFKGALRDLKVRLRRQRNRYLEASEIEKLKNASLNRQACQRAVDLSLLMFYLCGLDFVDLYYLKKKQIQDNRVFLTRKKLGDRAYEFDVKLFPEAKNIIKKYQDEDPKNEYVFPWRKTRTSYDTFINNLRREMAKVKKELAIKLTPKEETFTPKVLRHTFATLGKFEHIEEDLLRELMGHERNDIDTAYKDKYPEKERDEAQKLILGFAKCKKYK